MTIKHIDSNIVEISTQDNNCGGDKEFASAIYGLDDKFKNLLSEFSGPLLKDSSLLIQSTSNYLFDKDNNSIYSYNKGELSTNNYGGIFSIKSGDERVDFKIHSRFESDTFYFSKYMLSKISGTNLINTSSLASPETKGYDLLIYLFPFFLKKAFSHGIYKAYRRYYKNDEYLKGMIDIQRYLSKNIPFYGKFSYTYRDYTSNNYLILLVRHTIEFINKKHPLFLKNTSDNLLNKALLYVYENTSDYQQIGLKKLVKLNQKSILNPYYIEYERLKKLCLAILEYKQLEFKTLRSTPIYGIIYDLAWLWEEYLATILCNLKNNKFIHADSKRDLNGLPIYKGRNIFPDFYRGHQGNSDRYVVDAKYKNLDKEINREDLYQLVTYLHIFPAKRGSFVFPSSTKENTVTNTEYELEGLGGTISKIKIPIPKTTEDVSFKEFSEKMSHIEKELLNFFEVEVY